jgi:hypothetical protein
MSDETAKKIAAALITAMGMQSANQSRLANGLASAYDEGAFEWVIKDFKLVDTSSEVAS